jgi:phosphatidylinositol dimannoside acyltransferase
MTADSRGAAGIQEAAGTTEPGEAGATLPGGPTAPGGATAAPDLPARRATRSQRLRARLLGAVARFLIAVPEAPVNALGEAAGELWYRLAPDRAERARRNYRRVLEHLATRGLGSPQVRSAATDPAALERIVRRAFRQAVRYYLDMARLPGRSQADLERRLVVETPETVADAFGVPGPMVFASMHFGAVEFPALFAVARTGQRITAPMETLDDPALQEWIHDTRSSVGVDLVQLRDARRALTAALDDGRTVGMVVDRNVAGGTVDVPFFGVTAPLPMGPALLAMDRGLPIWLASVRRGARGRYLGQLRRVDLPTSGNRRARLNGGMAALAGAMEEAIAAAPEQWWSIFFPIWPDLDPEARTGTGHLEGAVRP